LGFGATPFSGAIAAFVAAFARQEITRHNSPMNMLYNILRAAQRRLCETG
jgi:hypothetical protein